MVLDPIYDKGDATILLKSLVFWPLEGKMAMSQNVQK